MENPDHFELFGLPAHFAIDEAALDAAYRQLQSQVHPDRFASASDVERRIAMQRATQANEAYRTLRSPLDRAIYLLSLRGIDVRSETSTRLEPSFLAQQLEWREAAGDAKAAKDVNALEAQLASLRMEKDLRFALLGALIDDGSDDEGNEEGNEAAAEAARQLLFIEKLEAELADGIESLESA
jgi:molecular chaperone HscB